MSFDQIAMHTKGEDNQELDSEATPTKMGRRDPRTDVVYLPCPVSSLSLELKPSLSSIFSEWNLEHSEKLRHFLPLRLGEMMSLFSQRVYMVSHLFLLWFFVVLTGCWLCVHGELFLFSRLA